MKSMTGYGRGVCIIDGRQITVELKSVNHRFLDLSIRLPRHLMFLEDAMRERISSTFHRGHIDVFVNYQNLRSDAKSVTVNTALLSAYVNAAKDAAAELGIANDMCISTALQFPDAVTVSEADEDQGAVLSLAMSALNDAISGLTAMREQEGARIHRDLTEKTDGIRKIKEKIAQRAPYVIEEYRERLRIRIAELCRDCEPDQALLATEVALFADRASIDEEIVRLTSHLTAMDGYLSLDTPTGANINFLVQEMNREINTIGSKANDSVLAQYVITAKAELEKIREQIQNIE